MADHDGRGAKAQGIAAGELILQHDLEQLIHGPDDGIRRRIAATVLGAGELVDVVADTLPLGEEGKRGQIERWLRVLLHEWLATFTWTGENLSAQPVSRAEEAQLRSRLPIAWRLAAPLLRTWRRVEKWQAGGYRSGAISYEVFVGEEDAQRTHIASERPGFRFPT